MRVKAGAAGFSLSVLLLAAAPGFAQSPLPPLPAPGFMPPYEVTRLVRSAGFDPVAPPLREGSTYVLRATDFRGILMRVVVDAHSGAFRAVNRIVAGPGPYGAIGMPPPPYDMPPPYGAPPPYDEPPAYGGPPAYGEPSAYGPPDNPEMAPDEAVLAPPLPPATRPAAHPFASRPPLPRPRPAELASRDAQAAKPGEAPVATPQASPGANAAAALPVQPKIAPTGAAKKPPPPPPINE